MFLHSSCVQCRGGGRLTPVMFDSGARDATDAVIALARGATAVGIGRPHPYALSYGGAESLTHFLKSFLAELDLCMAICGFKDIASLKAMGVKELFTPGTSTQDIVRFVREHIRAAV